MISLIDLYIYAFDSNRVKFLLLKRAGDKIYAHQWRMVGGKREPNETAWQAALREMKEETGLVPIDFWVLPSVNHFYEHKRDQIHLIPAFAAEIPFDSEILLDSEHSDFNWIDPEETETYLHWPEQIRLLQLLSSILNNGSILPEWRILK